MTSSAGGRASERSLQIMYGIAGEHDLTERALPHLRGWRNSAPVRVGNGAWGQTQLDVYGELLNSLYLYREQLGELHPEIQAFVADLANTAARRWRERGAGMWEMRGEPRHHVSSKVLCWVALDRALQLAPQLGEHANLEHWTAERDQIRQAILTRGWSEARQAYAQSFDSDELDAAQLLMPIFGFLPATDKRMRSTIEAIARDLTEDGLVLRYRNQEGMNADGLTGEEGTFVICSFWLVSALAKAGEVDRAEALFDKLVSYANDLGLLAEEIDTANGELLGNFPQAFSHIGLINAAWAIAQAREGTAGRDLVGAGRFWRGEGAHELPQDHLEAQLGWLRGFREQLQEWGELLAVIAVTESFVRTQGLYRGAQRELKALLAPLARLQRTKKVGAHLVAFVAGECLKVKPSERLLGSSEVIESVFGKVKRLEQDQAKSGLTGLILSVAAMVSTTTTEVIQKALATVSTKQVLAWCKKTLGPSVQAKRKKALAPRRPTEQKRDQFQVAV